MFVPKIEKFIGIEVYATRPSGIGGVIRRSVEDFIVEEVLVDGSKAETSGHVNCGVLGSSQVRGRYLLCAVVKRNWDTLHAIKAITEQLGISLKQVQIAGIKDAKAVTTQHITIEGVSADDIRKINVKDIRVQPIGYFRSKLSSYYLLGNSFNIAISSINYSKSAIKKRTARTIKELEALGGFPNFYGHQRFGTTRPITHLVGKAIVKGNFRKAAMLFLAKPSPYEHPASKQARDELKTTRDFSKALKNFPKQLRYERLMLAHLAKASDDFSGAFRRLPIKLRLLFPQAYQSYLFNRFLSKRIVNGLLLNRAEVGDYVAHVERSGLPLLTAHKIVTVETLTEINRAIKAGKMRLVLPLVGLRQHLSQGVQGEIEKRITEEENITPKDFQIKSLPEITLKGELRTAITPLNNFSLEQITKDSMNPSRNTARVSFTLHRGSYATVLLRELMKTRNPIKAGF